MYFFKKLTCSWDQHVWVWASFEIGCDLLDHPSPDMFCSVSRLRTGIHYPRWFPSPRPLKPDRKSLSSPKPERKSLLSEFERFSNRTPGPTPRPNRTRPAE